ncbi:MarR family transcriptional regulator [Pseudobacteriovorax antillogorgiicola]|uniref:DNA-binding transcriptional regulator, MarR family n=1 Tax=Pseudobacteriovorax antillogorgiicola TaxID=1513793 RepID=A0A1Y6C323_9BACT|nr:MarR family transcriptional regulator [Pseudobacteriovorax antillogorgiicola]TCS49810.1 DNA-binding MarR family transcriptional regulator [Pseudobacteriovorax antillogorgiicola]SMF43108.1 DNA-binding transcriptional regulator, MarR family [Pseudobacteriovorax antillogorgiicola]
MTSNEAFEKVKQGSLAHSLIKLGRLVNEQGIQNARQLFGLPKLSLAHLELFPHIDFCGTTVGEIAKRKGVSKQAVSKLVGQMIDMDILYMSDAEDDKRKKLVHFYTEGPRAIQMGFKALESVDEGLKEIIKSEEYELLLALLNQLLARFQEWDQI